MLMALTAMLGIVFFVLIAWLLSENRKAISWKFVVIALGFERVVYSDQHDDS